MGTVAKYSADIKAERGESVFAVIYARYSSHSQTEQSIEGQLAAGHAYAEAHGYIVVGEYIDRAMSGRTDNRADFQRMLADTDKKAFDVIIVWKVDRFGRNRQQIAFNKHRCKRNGVKLEYVAETLNDSPESIILESVLQGMAEYYSVQLSTNVIRGLRQSAEKAQFTGGKPPLGYRVDPQTKRYEIDPATAPIVREIFESYTSGKMVTQIFRELNARGFVTQRKRPFGKNSMYAILTNERYTGSYLFKADKPDGVRIDDAFPAIITQEMFDKAQDLMKTNRRAPKSSWNKTDYLLTGKLFCGKCGSAMVGVSGTGKHGELHTYYSCVGHFRSKTCDKKAVRREWIEGIVLQQIHKLLDDRDVLDWIADKTWQYYQTQDTAKAERAAIQAQLDAVNTSISNIVKAIEAGLFNSALQQRMTELDAQKTALTASLAEFDLVQDAVGLTRDHILFFLMQFRDMDASDRECQRRLISTFVNAIYLYDDKLTMGFNYSGPANTVTLQQVEKSGQGFVYRRERPAKQEPYEPVTVTVVGKVVLITKKLPE